jgi:hypothetical protein
MQTSTTRIMYSEFGTTNKYERTRMMRDDLVKNGDGFLGCTFLTFCKIITDIECKNIYLSPIQISTIFNS